MKDEIETKEIEGIFKINSGCHGFFTTDYDHVDLLEICKNAECFSSADVIGILFDMRQGNKDRT